MMLALAVLDLPFEAAEARRRRSTTASITLTAGGPVIVFHKEIKPAAAAHAGQARSCSCSQSFFRHGDRYRQEGNEKFDKYVTDGIPHRRRLWRERRRDQSDERAR